MRTVLDYAGSQQATSVEQIFQQETKGFKVRAADWADRRRRHPFGRISTSGTPGESLGLALPESGWLSFPVLARLSRVKLCGLGLSSGDSMPWGKEHDDVREVVIDYLEGMVWGDEERLRRAFHPGALQVGHFGETYEFFPLQEFIDWLKAEETETPGTPYTANLLSIEVTGTVAIAKLTDTCFGTDFTDYLVMVKDRPDASGRWQIVTKAYHVHAGRGLPPSSTA